MLADSEQMKEAGVRFLCRWAEDLGVPYKWSTILNKFHTSLYDKGFMIAVDGQDQVRGVLAYSYGTGENNSADPTRLIVHLIYIEDGYRGGTALAGAIDALSERELELMQPVEEIGFRCSPSNGYRRLFGKFAEISDTSMHPCGMLDSYVTTPERLRDYVAKAMSSAK
jgi:hypothetical protein